jgi:D-alanine--D-alanine ligase
MNKLNIGILMGGKSIEREVSFNSGRTICDHLDTTHYNVIPLFQTIKGQLFILPSQFMHRGKIIDFQERLHIEAQKITWDDLKQLVDCLYIALHGRWGEDGTLQGFLEILKIPYVGSKVMASALGMDKAIQKTFLKLAGIAVPKSLVVLPHEIDLFNPLTHPIGYPCVIKPHKEGSSLGVSVIHEHTELIDALHTACTINPGIRQPVLIEEYIQGMEFSCVVLTNYKTGELLPLPPTEIVLTKSTSFCDYDQKYMPGYATKYTPARCSAYNTERIQQTCIQTMRTLGITNMARIDGILTEHDEIFIIDPNTFTGTAPASFTFLQAAEVNMSHTNLINHLIETELHTYGITMAQQHYSISSTTRIRVAVLFGGNSNEKEISLESGRNVVYKLSPQKYEAIPLFVDSKFELYHINQRLLVRNKTHAIEQELEPKNKILWSNLSSIADFVFIALHGGQGENGCLQGTLEMLDIPYNGSSVLASSLCMDKYKTTQFLKQEGFSVPQAMLISREEFQEKTLSLDLPASYPLIVKPHDDGCSILVHKVNNDDELIRALTTLFNSGKKYALIEELIIGTELSVGVIGNKTAQALPPTQVIAEHGILSIEEKFLPGQGENRTPAPLASTTLQLIQKTMEEAYSRIGCKGYARIDCFYQSAHETGSKERVVILEVNTLPGLTPATCIFHQAAEVGIKPMDFIDLIVQLGLEEHSASTSTSPTDGPLDVLSTTPQNTTFTR